MRGGGRRSSTRGGKMYASVARDKKRRHLLEYCRALERYGQKIVRERVENESGNLKAKFLLC